MSMVVAPVPHLIELSSRARQPQGGHIRLTAPGLTLATSKAGLATLDLPSSLTRRVGRPLGPASLGPTPGASDRPAEAGQAHPPRSLSPPASVDPAS